MPGFKTHAHTYLVRGDNVPFGQQGTYAAFDISDARFKDGFATLADANDYAISRRYDCAICGMRNGH